MKNYQLSVVGGGLIFLSCTMPAIAGWQSDFEAQFSGLSTNATVAWDMSNCGFLSGKISPSYLNHNKGKVNASQLSRPLGLKSCINDGSDGKSLELNYGLFNHNDFNPNDLKSLKFSFTLSPHQYGRFESLSFKEKQSRKFFHGDFKYYGIRVLKGDDEIYRNLGNRTTRSWSLENISFPMTNDFEVTEETQFTVEILPYHLTGFNVFGALWAVDEVSINAHADSLPLVSSCTSGFEVKGAIFHPKFENQLPQPPKIDATQSGTSLTMQMRQSCQWLGFYDVHGEKIYTTVWGYSQKNHPPMHMGPTIETYKDVSVDIKWENKLPYQHLLPSAHADGRHVPHNVQRGLPTVTHLHGGHSEPASDGYPTAWFSRDFFDQGDDFVKQTYTYHNTQEAAPLWYHDHVLGMTRLSVNAGLAAMYLIRDDNEQMLDLPSGEYEREIVIQDVQLDKNGQLARNNEFPAFFGDYILVNGMAWPVLDVEPRKYRFRILNASDSRFYRLKMNHNMEFIQIGTEGGLIESPVNHQNFLIGPGERYDMVVDFSGQEGKEITLKNLEGILSILPPLNPAIKKLMRFRVKHWASEQDTPLPDVLRDPIVPLGEPDNVRQVLLGQAWDTENGGIIDLLGTVEGGLMRWGDDITEIVQLNDVEEWEIYNTLLVRHPIHIHQVEFQIIDRQPVLPLGADLFYPAQNPGITPVMIGQPQAPEAWENGWKDEVIVPPLTRVRVRMRFDIPGDFVWHCHILTHEDHDMMRPLTVIE